MRLVSLFILFITVTLATYSGRAQNKCICNQLFEISNGSKTGFIDCNGKVVVKPRFEEVQPFFDGVSVVTISRKKIGENENGSPKYEFKSGIVHVDGTVIELPNTWITDFSEGLAFARIDDNYVFINKLGKVIFKIKNDLIEQSMMSEIPFGTRFSGGFAKLPRKDGKSFLIDTQGNYSITENGKPLEFDKNGLALVNLGEKGNAILDKNGKYLIGPKKNIIGSVREVFFSESEKSEGVYQFFDIKGKEIFQVNADYIGRFVEGLAPINIGNKWGFINEKGEIKIPIKYSKAYEFSEGLASVVDSNNKLGFINQKGSLVIAAIYDASVFQAEFECGLVYVQKNDYEGYINKKGKWVWKKRIG